MKLWFKRHSQVISEWFSTLIDFMCDISLHSSSLQLSILFSSYIIRSFIVLFPCSDPIFYIRNVITVAYRLQTTAFTHSIIHCSPTLVTWWDNHCSSSRIIFFCDECFCLKWGYFSLILSLFSVLVRAFLHLHIVFASVLPYEHCFFNFNTEGVHLIL